MISSSSYPIHERFSPALVGRNRRDRDGEMEVERESTQVFKAVYIIVLVVYYTLYIKYSHSFIQSILQIYFELIKYIPVRCQALLLAFGIFP